MKGHSLVQFGRRSVAYRSVREGGAGHFRKACRRRFSSHPLPIARLPARARTCFEGPFGEVIRATGPMAKANPFRFSTKYQDDDTDLLYYGVRYYTASSGRWLSRDPAEASPNEYVAVANDPLSGTDYLGLWDERIHLVATKMWAGMAKYPAEAAQAVANADNGVDEKFGPTSYITEPGTQYHFDRSLSMGSSEDTRMTMYKKHLKVAQDDCTIALGKDDPEDAAKQLGTALHPYQDWVAHGDHNKRLLGSFQLDPRYIHNYLSPKKGSTGFPDDPALDANGSPDGRATMSVLHFVVKGDKIFDWADYEPGHKRFALTYRMSSSALATYRAYVASNGGCKCKKYFGIK